MKPVDQTTFGVPGGNCFSACVASLLELPIEEVPYFMGEKDWFVAFEQWLKRRGYWAITTDIKPGARESDTTWWPKGYYILSGNSPRGSHAVVARKKRIVHDPHPSRDGLLAWEDIIVLVPFELPCPEARRLAEERDTLLARVAELERSLKLAE